MMNGISVLSTHRIESVSMSLLWPNLRFVYRVGWHNVDRIHFEWRMNRLVKNTGINSHVSIIVYL